jgi:hypothetical protein
MIFRFNLRYVAIILAVIVIAALVYEFFPRTSSSGSLPPDVIYSIEFFNAVSQNKTIMVPTQYYTLAKQFSINGNSVIENQTEYANILLRNETYPGIDFVLIDMGQLDNLSELSSLAGVQDPSVTQFSATAESLNISSDYRDCLVYNSSVDEFAECNLFIGGTKVGDVGIARFPGAYNVSITNASVLYNGTHRVYLLSDASYNSTNFKSGLVFAYDGVATFYMPHSLMESFYGKEMFLPAGLLGNSVLDEYGESRVIRLN